MRWASGLVVLAALAGVGCSGGGGGGPTHDWTLQVLVEDAAGPALDGATVVTEPASSGGTTGADGRAELTGDGPGTFLVTASSPGYLPVTAQVEIPEGTTSLTLQLVAGEALAAWYPLDASGEDVVGGHDASSVSATPCPDRFGRADRAYAFDGSSDLIALPSLLPEATAQLTAAAWVKPAVVDRQLVVISVQDHSGFDLGLIAGKVYWFIMTGPTSGSSYAGAQDVLAGEWQHVAFTRAGGVLRTYLQGVLTGEEVDLGDDGTAPGLGGGNTIGGFTTDQPVRFEGAMEDVQVFTRALSAEEVAALARR